MTDHEDRATLRLGPGQSPEPTLPCLRFLVVEGADRGKEFTVETDPVRIGAAVDNALRIADPAVSRHHALILHRPEGYLLRDLDSTNGTYLDGNRIREAYVAPGAKIRIGSTVFVFERRDQPVTPDEADHFGDLYSISLSMRKLFTMLRRLAASDVTVIFRGETGTGKELAARAIHRASRRRAGPFAVLDCSAVDRELVSAELFGHEVGAFTGATVARVGAFEAAQDGTLFLDELGELPIDLQAKLLRALETREVKRLGGAKPIAFDCRVLAATHRDLATMVAEGKFREDLYFRLAQVVVRIPPLRERPEDIAFLAQRFLSAGPRSSGPTRFSEAALRRLSITPMRGNVRELRNLVERARALATSDSVGPEDLDDPGAETAAPPPPGPAPAAPAAVDPGAGLGSAIESVERAAIEEALKAAYYNRSRAAEILGISLPTLRNRIRRYGIWMPQRGKDD